MKTETEIKLLIECCQDALDLSYSKNIESEFAMDCENIWREKLREKIDLLYYVLN